jgi:transposase
MFIRQSPIKSKKTGGSYFSYRLVENVRVDGKVKQKTLLNLGKHFDVDPAHWTLLATRISQIIEGGEQSQSDLFDTTLALDQTLENAAQRYAAWVIQKLSVPLDEGSLSGSQHDYHSVDVNRIAVLEPRSIGAETLALSALKQLKLDEKLRALGFIEKDVGAAIGTIIGRMVHPGSERETHRWLQENSALDELIDYDYEKLSLDRLYQVADKLLTHKKAIESHLERQEERLFTLQRTVILYDLTNTYFEGQALGNTNAKRGRSKEKRYDCPLVTMGLVLDGDGFPLASDLFPGNASEPATLEPMLASLTASSQCQGSIVVLDAGIATQDNLDWLKENKYRYIVVSRDRSLQQPALDEGAVVVKDEINDRVIAQRVEVTETGETRLYCHSQKREAKDRAIRTQFNARFEDKLSTLDNGLRKKGTTKKYEKILERIGRLKEKYARVSQDYTIEVETNDDKTSVTKIRWTRKESSKVKDDLAGVYCLRTDVKELSEKELWSTYVMLTDVEACFKSMKSELGMRPIYHQKEQRVTAHLFITLIAYHLVHTLRVQLKNKGVTLSWQGIRNTMASQQRVTVTMPTEQGQQIHIRKTTEAEPRHRKLYDVLGLASDVLGARKTIIQSKLIKKSPVVHKKR